MIINNIMNFDDARGLSISTRGEILEDLKNLTKIAYGDDYVIEQGNEWYSFLDLLSGVLADIGGATQQVYNSLSFTTAAGTNLDNVVSFVGITRKTKQNSTVTIKAEITTQYQSTLARPYTIPTNGVVLKDSNDNLWTNIEPLVIAEYKDDETTPNYVGTATFEATDKNADPTNVVLQPYNNGTLSNLVVVDNPIVTNNFTISEGIVFINETASKLGNQEETDAQLRARYKAEVYKNSVGTVEGLIAQIKNDVQLDYVYVFENNSNDPITDSSSPGLGMLPHSIWVITDGESTWGGTGTYTDDPNDIAIANAILNYKSLGCGTSLPTAEVYDSTNGTGAITAQITLNSTTYEIKFSRANKVPCYVNIELSTDLLDAGVKSSIEYAIKTNIMNYISNLGIGNDVLQSGLSSAVYNVIEDNNYTDYVFDINSITVGNTATPTTKRQSIEINQYATIDEANITITWE